MRVKYYMRGIGIGIILTVILCSLGNKELKGSMSDYEIIEAAKQLGMELKSEKELDLSILKATVTPIPEEKTEDSITLIPTPTQPLDEMVSPVPTEAEKEPSKEPLPTSVADDYREFQIKSGMGSEKVAKVVQEAGLVEDWDDFNRYLISKGYSSKIRTSNYRLPIGVSYDEIAKEITKKP